MRERLRFELTMRELAGPYAKRTFVQTTSSIALHPCSIGAAEPSVTTSTAERPVLLRRMARVIRGSSQSCVWAARPWW